MSHKITFAPYSNEFQDTCLTIFDENCPQYFAPNERQDYLAFLTNCPDGYEVCFVADNVAGAYGLCGGAAIRSINWIMISSQYQGEGVGSAMMTRAMAIAGEHGIQTINIAASHLSAPFFALFGARKINEIPHGWGENMHRIDMVLAL